MTYCPGKLRSGSISKLRPAGFSNCTASAEIRIPILEKTDLFRRSIGDTTDIVEKEMYSFVDKGENAVTMRPEGTASVMRAFIEHKMYAADPIARLYYIGPMFRYERPQKGRYRQFHQIGAEITGVTSPAADAQVLTMLCHFFAELGLTEPRLEINSLGCPDCRPLYRNALKDFLRSRIDQLCDDCRRRFETNPLRVLDCKATGCKEATAGAPSVLDHLCAGCNDHFARTRGYLDAVGTVYTINSRMVRGLDYYTRTTFELVTGLSGRPKRRGCRGALRRSYRRPGRSLRSPASASPLAWSGWHCC